MKSQLDKIVKDTTHHSLLNHIKPLTTLNAVDQIVISSQSSKYGLLTKLQVTHHTVK